ncbi:MAG TPA: beta-L-arabinofuranosidase domain-containing protein [Chthoniobacterales bacterium]|nr:beta-L-arabinofuranosidase domain-containing protein [Chthoniobacterales bacterium]
MPPNWRPLSQSNVSITEGFWGTLQQKVGKVTLRHIYDQMLHQGHLDALRLDQRMHRGRQESNNWYWGGSIFWDSDVAKWLEAASAYLHHSKDPRVDSLVDGTIELLAGAQQPDGYLNSHILTWRPRHRFKNLRDLHELYCAGHIIEAAVAHRQATGKENLLNVALRLADCLTTVFGNGPGQIPGYCGHPEIELALVRLYRLTREERYLNLCRFFIDERGKTPHYYDQEAVQRLDSKPFRPNHPVSPYAYMQAHIPIRAQKEAVGHAVRAMYLYSAVADLAYELNDDGLADVCKTLWQDLCQTKLYITGGIGSDAENEGFTRRYDLPNLESYAETCAAVALFQWAHRLAHLDLDSQYADMMETVLYNAVLSGLGADGKTFFYHNPLASDGSQHRVNWPWWCPCCPANLARLILSLSGYLYSSKSKSIAVHHYVSSEVRFSIDGRDSRLTAKSDFPFEGNASIRFEDVPGVPFELLLRVPRWAGGSQITINGAEFAPEVVAGYAVVARSWSSGDEVTVRFEMPVQKQFSNYELIGNRGRVAITRGPLVYCAEEVDNVSQLDRLAIGAETVTEVELKDGELGRHATLSVSGSIEEQQDRALYSLSAQATKPCSIKMIPYYLWDNRTAGEMLVWIRHAES